MGSEMTTRMERNNMRLLKTKIVGKKPLTFTSHYEDAIWDHESSSPHSERAPSRCEDPHSFPHELHTNKKPAKAILANQINSIGSGETHSGLIANPMKSLGSRETHSGESALQNTRYIIMNNRVCKDPRSTSHLDTLSPSTDVGSTRALAGLIFMCNDRVRRSFLKYSVLGAPLAKKHILDRVNTSTKLFLFEFEARALWGIYEATSRASIDIEKDAYLGSETAFPAQVKVRVYRQCRPLPERLFQLAIEDNYFSPTKFNFELTEKQVSKLTKLYNMREPEKFVSVTETSIPYLTAGRNLFSGAQDESLYDGVRMNGKAMPDAQKNIPYAERIQTVYKLDGLSQIREGLVRGNDSTEANICMGGRYLGNVEHDALKRFSLYHKDHPFSKMHKDYPFSKKEEFESTIVCDINGRRGSRPGLHADATTPLVDPRTTTLHCYPHEEEDILLEDDLRHQLYQSKLPQHADDPTYESNARTLDAHFRSPMNLSDVDLKSSTSFEHSLSEENYPSKLKTKQLNDSILIRRLPLRSPSEDLRNEASVYQRLGKSLHSCDEALWDLQSESMKVFKPCSTPLSSMQSLRTSLPTSQLHARQMHDILQGTGNRYVTQGRRGSFINQRTVSMPPETWTENSDHCINGIVARAQVGPRSKAMTVLDDEAQRGNLWHEQFSRSKILQDDVEAQVEDATCFENCYTARNNCTETDDAGWYGNIRCAVDLPVADIEVEDEARLESARRDAMNSFTLRNWDNAEDIFEDGEGDLVQVESKSLSRISKKRFTVAVEDDVKPRRSVWSRLSTSSNAFKTQQVSNELVLPEKDLSKPQLASGSLPWKRRPISTLTCETNAPVYEVGEEFSIEEECSSFERNEVNVDFKRRKGTLNKVVSVGKADDTNEERGTMEMKTLREHGDSQRRRKIRRPL